MSQGLLFLGCETTQPIRTTLKPLWIVCVLWGADHALVFIGESVELFGGELSHPLDSIQSALFYLCHIILLSTNVFLTLQCASTDSVQDGVGLSCSV